MNILLALDLEKFGRLCTLLSEEICVASTTFSVLDANQSWFLENKHLI